MIAKCVALLAVVAQINAYVCNSNVAAPVVGANGVAATRNFVAKGRYPVALSNTGPLPDCRVPVTSSRVTTPVQEKPLVRLPATIPAPKTVAHSCTCYKQILRPRVHDQYITVPTIQRYIETSHAPVIENIHYEAVPVNAPESRGVSCVNSGLVSGVVGGVNSGLVSGVVGGVNSGLVSGVVGGVNSGLVSGVVGGVNTGLVSGVATGVNTGLVSGVVGGINSGLVSGVVGSYPVAGVCRTTCY